MIEKWKALRLALTALLLTLAGCAHDKDIVFEPSSNIFHPCDTGDTLYGGILASIMWKEKVAME